MGFWVKWHPIAVLNVPLLANLCAAMNPVGMCAIRRDLILRLFFQRFFHQVAS